MKYNKVRLSQPTKTGSSASFKLLKTKYKDLVHNHKILCTKVQAEYQKIDFCFATIRSPYDRVISMYNFFEIANRNNTFNEFLDKLKVLSKTMIIFYPQVRYVKNKDYEVDDIIRMETYDKDAKRIFMDTLGFDSIPEKVNVTEKKLITKLTKKQKLKIQEIYPEDFEILNYEK